MVNKTNMDDSSFNFSKDSIFRTIKQANQAYFGRKGELLRYNATCEVQFSNTDFNFCSFDVLEKFSP